VLARRGVDYVLMIVLVIVFMYVLVCGRVDDAQISGRKSLVFMQIKSTSQRHPKKHTHTHTNFFGVEAA
jgi:translation initiation factor 2 beta subunit (eIF-2beta)/eIF-5